MQALQELDLNGTQVTDAGLMSSRIFPPWRGYGWPGTRITDQGFHRTLFAKDSLMQLDLSGTQSVARLARAGETPGRTKSDAVRTRSRCHDVFMSLWHSVQEQRS